MTDGDEEDLGRRIWPLAPPPFGAKARLVGSPSCRQSFMR